MSAKPRRRRLGHRLVRPVLLTVLVTSLHACGRGVTRAIGEFPTVADTTHATVIGQLTSPLRNLSFSDAVLSLVRGISVDAPEEHIRERLDSLLTLIGRSTRADMPWVRESLFELRSRSAAVRAIADAYAATPSTDVQKRILLLVVLGELQRPDALAAFRTIMDTPLPPPHSGERKSDYEREVLLQMVAVDGIAYIRTAEDAQDTSATAAVIGIARSHESHAVRITAIDAIMWNADEPAAMALQLYATLPAEYHKYVERPRFDRTMMATDFQARVDAWRRRWDR